MSAPSSEASQSSPQRSWQRSPWRFVEQRPILPSISYHGVQKDGTHLGRVSLDESGVDGVGHGEARHIGSELISFNLVGGEGWGGLQGLERVDLHNGSFVGDNGDESVVNKFDLSQCGVSTASNRKREYPTDFVVLNSGFLDSVGDGEGISEGGNISTDLVESEGEVGSDSSNELLLGLLSETDDRDLLAESLSLLNITSSSFSDGRVNSSAETSIGRDDDVEDLLDLGLGFSGFRLREDGRVGDTVSFSLNHGFLSSSESGGCPRSNVESASVYETVQRGEN